MDATQDSNCGSFNLEQMLPENVSKIAPLMQNFNLLQCSQYSTDLYKGILDIVFDSFNSNIVAVAAHSQKLTPIL